MKKILITGGLGYIGMELAKVFSGLTRNYEVTVLDVKYYSSRVNQLKIWGVGFKQINILDSSTLKDFIKDFDVVYHLAGITDVPQTKGQSSKELNEEIKKVGIDGTRNILNYTKKDCKIIFPSTHVVFEGLRTVKKNLDELNNPKPVLEYSKSKYQSEKDIIESGKKYVILRLGSVYGNSFDSTRLNIMPNLFAKITSQNGTISLFGGGKQLKSLVNIVDVARAMQFVGENDTVNNEIFHLSNETITVKEVANACKKINKKIKIISTNDDVPNLGYGLNSDKIKKLGFKYLYNLPNSLKEMYLHWKDIDILKDNEFIIEGKDNYSDSRGVISNYYFEDAINMIGAVDSVKGSIRGNHYHPIQTQKCLLVSGSYISLTKDLLDKNSVIETLLVKSGELSIIPPNVAHTMVFLEDSVLLNLVTGEREHDNYGITHTMKYDLVDTRLAENLIESYKTKCRVCESKNLEPYIKLGLSPLANNLLEKKEDNYDKYPLEVNFCSFCFNSQLSVAVPSKKMFDNYLYLSSTTDTFKLHFQELAKKLKTELNLTQKSLVVDIGSNDGIFLKPLLNYRIKAIGVEPARNVSKIANKNGIKTINRYFDEKCIKKISSEYGKADVITAFNVFAHADNLKGILNNVSKLLKKDGVFVFEVQYLLRTLKDLTFDNIYHEHFNYWCLLSLQNLFKYSDLNIYKVEEVDTHGGSLRVYASKNQNVKIHSSVKKYISLELDNKLNKFQTYENFGKKVEKIKLTSLKKINNLLNEGKTIIGYAAPAKATTVLNYFGISEKEVQFTIDDNSLKHEKYIPGVGIKIISSDTENLNYDYVLILAWNFFDAIVQSNKSRFPKSKFIKLK
jgi:nucleoside-diphosphate-sugar epimerase/SAM-dependent methyltransferase/dTDP-4-dehydrorhamnose 3,5-epimerase-like enzyme